MVGVSGRANGDALGVNAIKPQSRLHDGTKSGANTANTNDDDGATMVGGASGEQSGRYAAAEEAPRRQRVEVQMRDQGWV